MCVFFYICMMMRPFALLVLLFYPGNGQLTETPPTEVLRSEQERTCVIGFVCKHGYCVISNTLQCVCDPGWIGVFCEKLCPLDCGQHGQCTVFNGTPKCECDWQYTGAKCDKVIEISVESTTVCTNCDSPTATSLSKVIETAPTVVKRKECFPGFVCQNGYCPSGKVECVCDLGWTGPFCDELCLLDCGQFGQCKSLGASSQSCVCEAGYTGPNCQHHPLSNDSTTAIITSTTPVPTSDTTTIPLSTVTTIRHLNNTDLFQHPVKDRKCVPGFVCEHGICLTNNNKSQTLNCVCDDGWTGILCNKRCPLDCGDFGKCETNDNGTSYCSCNWTYTGVLCDVLKPEKLQEGKDYSWQWWVIGICITLFVLLVLVLVIVPYVLWRKKELFIMKIIYLFQPFEDSDDKLFDAFISYKSTMIDENFVLNELFPRLETQMNFKLCLHFRDFIPGETISNNIIWAVENSRRTILILTPDYVESEFCMFEYQKAQHEMLRRKQRIIPIMLQDINHIELVDKTLQSILHSITYLEWPGEDSPKKIEKFWKRLEFSMPKKKSLVSKSEITRPSDDDVVLKSVSDSSKNRPMSTVEDKAEFIELSIDSVDGIDNLALNTPS